MTEGEFDRYLKAEYDSSPKKQSERFNKMIHAVEKEYCIPIRYDYPYFKVLSQYEYLLYVQKETKRLSKKGK